MNRLISTVILAGSLGIGAQAMANDPPSSSDMPANSNIDTHQMMKECMAKQKAANNGMSEDDMRKSCRDQIKAKIDNPDASAPVVPAH